MNEREFYTKLEQFAASKDIDYASIASEYYLPGIIYSEDTELGNKEAASTVRKVDGKTFPIQPSPEDMPSNLYEAICLQSDKKLYVPLDTKYRVHKATDHARAILKVLHPSHIPFIYRKARENYDIKGELIHHPKSGIVMPRFGALDIADNGTWCEIGLVTLIDGITKAVEHKGNYRKRRLAQSKQEKAQLAAESKELYDMVYELTKFDEVDTAIRTEIMLAGLGLPHNDPNKFDPEHHMILREKPFSTKNSKIYRGEDYWAILWEQALLMEKCYAQPAQVKLRRFMEALKDEYLYALRKNTINDVRSSSDMKMRFFLGKCYKQGTYAEHSKIDDAFERGSKTNYLQHTYNLTTSEIKSTNPTEFKKDYHGPIQDQVESKHVIPKYLERIAKQDSNEKS